MKKLVLLVFFFGHLAYSNVPVWGKTGHRVVGEVAQMHLSKRAKRGVQKILKGQSLASVANYADNIKSDTLYRKFSPWHYVNFPADKKYTEVTPSSSGDLVMAIQKCVEIVKNPNSSEADKSFYLKMLVHLVGDLHQPMHAGRKEDKGGNDIQIRWFGNGSNLHRLWDSDMIDKFGMSYTELADNLPVITKNERKQLQIGTVYDWVEESQDIANELYDSVEIGEQLGYRYSYVYWDTVEQQLLKGGLRLASVLNELFR